MSKDGNAIEQTPLRAPAHILAYYKQQAEAGGARSRNQLIAGILAYFKDELEAMPEEQRIKVLESLPEYESEA